MYSEWLHFTHANLDSHLVNQEMCYKHLQLNWKEEKTICG